MAIYTRPGLLGAKLGCGLPLCEAIGVLKATNRY